MTIKVWAGADNPIQYWELEEIMEESNIEAAEKVKATKKHAVAYLKGRASELDQSLAKNFVASNFALAAHDADQLAAVMRVLGQIDLS